jgi:hypothetical protein
VDIVQTKPPNFSLHHFQRGRAETVLVAVLVLYSPEGQIGMKCRLVKSFKGIERIDSL